MVIFVHFSWQFRVPNPHVGSSFVLLALLSFKLWVHYHYDRQSHCYQYDSQGLLFANMTLRQGRAGSIQVETGLLCGPFQYCGKYPPHVGWAPLENIFSKPLNSYPLQYKEIENKNSSSLVWGHSKLVVDLPGQSCLSLWKWTSLNDPFPSTYLVITQKEGCLHGSEMNSKHFSRPMLMIIYVNKLRWLSKFLSVQSWGKSNISIITQS